MAFSLLVSVAMCAQAPSRISYQAVVRDASGDLVKSGAVGVRVSILKGSAGGPVVYEEVHAVTSDDAGVVRFEIGDGGSVTGQLDTIQWVSDTYYFKQEIDPTGGSAYSVSGTTALLSVPYALYSTRTDAVDLRVSATGDTLYTGSGTGVIIPGLSRAAVRFPDPVYADGYVHCFGGGDTTVIVDVINPLTGKAWMDRNLGASRVATVYNDADSYGDLFQWGRFADGHQCARDPNKSLTTSTLATTAVSTISDAWYGKFITNSSNPDDWIETQDSALWQGTNRVNNPCPAGYRVPTQPEWEAERNSWNEYNRAGAMASTLKLPAAGYRYSSDGVVYSAGNLGNYWSSSVSGSNTQVMAINSGNVGWNSVFRAIGYSVRCLKDPL